MCSSKNYLVGAGNRQTKVTLSDCGSPGCKHSAKYKPVPKESKTKDKSKTENNRIYRCPESDSSFHSPDTGQADRERDVTNATLGLITRDH
ncbi:hypothetical protein E4U47_006866 [Claviceps purpurea]|nr:hypothetical protein E4U47_006866 [Claviceps purpurea]